MTPLDRVVAEVDGVVITQSEVVAEASLSILRLKGPKAAQGAQLEASLLRNVLRARLTRELILAESRRLSLRPIPQSEVDDAVARLRARFENHQAYLAFLVGSGFADEILPEESAPLLLIDLLRAELIAQRFLDLRLRTAVELSSRSVRACWASHRALFGFAPFAEAQAAVKKKMSEAIFVRKLRALALTLQEQANLRFAPGFDVREIPPIRDGFSCVEGARISP